MFLSRRPFVVITAFSTGLVGVEVTSVSEDRTDEESESSGKKKNTIFDYLINRRIFWELKEEAEDKKMEMTVYQTNIRTVSGDRSNFNTHKTC